MQLLRLLRAMQQAPLYNRGCSTVAPQRHTGRQKKAGCCTSTKSRKGAEQTGAEPWPAEYQLPSLAVLEELSQPGGVVRQQELFQPEPLNNSKAGRLARLLAVPGVMRARIYPPI